MHKFFEYIIKQKKIFIFLAVFLVSFVLIVMPTVTHATVVGYVKTNVRNIIGCAFGAAGCASSLIINNAFTGNFINPPDNSTNPGIVYSTIMVFIVGIPVVLMYILSTLAWLSGSLYVYVSNTIIGLPITRDPVFLSSWAIVRDFANMLIVLALIGIAVATILRLKEYEAKKLLPSLIIIALLINFSGVFIGLMIDVSNIAMKTFIDAGGDPNTTIITNIDSMKKIVVAGLQGIFSEEYGSTNAAIEAALGVATTSTGVSVLYLLIAFILFYFDFLIIVRYGILAILFILSPLAFVFRFFPLEAAKGIWEEWWKNFLKWCFVGVGLAFSMYLSSEILARTGMNAITVAVVVLLVGIRMTLKSGAPFASLAMGLATATIGAVVTGGASLAMGAAGAAARFGYKKSGAEEGVRGIRDSITDNSTVNSVRDFFQGTGASATKRNATMQQRLKPHTERLGGITDNREGNQQLADVAVNGRSAAERAAATNMLKERGSLDSILPHNRRAAMQNAMAHDSKLKVSDFSKTDYRYAELDDRAIDRIRTTKMQDPIFAAIAQQNPRHAQELVERAAKQEQLEANLPGMSPAARRNIDPTDLTADLITSRSFNASYIRNFKTADRGQINALRNPAIRAELKRLIKDAKFGVVDRRTGIRDPKSANKAEYNRLRAIRTEITSLP